MTKKNWLSIATAGIITTLPQLLPLIPPPYSVIATALIGALVSAWHLYAEVPS